VSDLDDGLTEAQRVVSDAVVLLHRTRAARQQLEARPASARGVEAERIVCLTLLTSPEKELLRGLETALAALKAARKEADSPADQWLRQQLEALGD